MEEKFPEHWLTALEFVKKFKAELTAGGLQDVTFADLVALFVHLTKNG